MCVMRHDGPPCACRDVPYPIKSYTFGSPRTGNAAFAEACDAVVPDTFRFHNEPDIVAQVPFFFGYKHVKCQARLHDGGTIFLREDNPISVFDDGTIPPQVRPHRGRLSIPRAPHKPLAHRPGGYRALERSVTVHKPAIGTSPWLS